jgi:AcrR family transcriptional regulator
MSMSSLPGPRERRRVRTMREIQGEALRLFESQGYAETTVDQIAEASDISPRTFFRYFPTKEDVVLWDEYDAVIGELLMARPPDEPLGETLRVVTRAAIEGLYRNDPARLLARNRLMLGEPALSARFLESAREGVSQIGAAFAASRGLAPDDLVLQVTASALIDAVLWASDRWQRSGGSADLLALVDEAVAALVHGVAGIGGRRAAAPRR